MSPSVSVVSIGGNSVVPMSRLPSSRYTGPAPAAARNIPLASTHPSPLRAPPEMNTGRGAHIAISSCASTGMSPGVSGPAYFMKLPAIQWYSLLPDGCQRPRVLHEVASHPVVLVAAGHVA